MSVKSGTRRTGAVCEEYASRYFERSGYRIFARNYMPARNAEADIIALDGEVLVAVEVKAVMSEWDDECAGMKISPRKLCKIRSALDLFCREKHLGCVQKRVDAVFIRKDRLVHYKDVQ